MNASHTARGLSFQRIVKLDEARLGRAVDWLADSVHQHMDNVVVGLIAGVLTRQDIYLATVIACVSCFLSMYAVWLVKHHAHNAASKTHGPTAAERQWDSELAAMVRKHEAQE